MQWQLAVVAMVQLLPTHVGGVVPNTECQREPPRKYTRGKHGILEDGLEGDEVRKGTLYDGCGYLDPGIIASTAQAYQQPPT